MQVNAHNPILHKVNTLRSVAEFHVVNVIDKTGGELAIYVEGDWSDWDALVEAVAAYRAQQDAEQLAS